MDVHMWHITVILDDRLCKINTIKLIRLKMLNYSFFTHVLFSWYVMLHWRSLYNARVRYPVVQCLGRCI